MTTLDESGEHFRFTLRIGNRHVIHELHPRDVLRDLKALDHEFKQTRAGWAGWGGDMLWRSATGDDEEDEKQGENIAGHGRVRVAEPSAARAADQEARSRREAPNQNRARAHFETRRTFPAESSPSGPCGESSAYCRR